MSERTSGCGGDAGAEFADYLDQRQQRRLQFLRDVGTLSEIVSRVLPMPISSSSAPGSFNAETNHRTAFRSRPIAVQPAED